MGNPKTAIVLADGSELKTVVALADDSEAIPALVTVQVLSLFDIEKRVLTAKDIYMAGELPRESVLLLVENQIRRLSVLRRHNFVGAVVILSSMPFASLLKKHHYILRYGASSSAAWQSPWQLADLLSKLTKLKPLSPGNLNLLKQEMQAASERIDKELESVLIYLEKLNPNSPDFPNQLNHIENTVENLFSKTPLARHVLIELEGHSTATIQHHFRTLMNDIVNYYNNLSKQKMLLNQVLRDWQKQVQSQAEDIEVFLDS
jgi:hypothetical protein